MQVTLEWFNEDDLLFGIHLLNGVTEDGEDLIVFSFGFIFFRIDITTKRP